MLSQLMATFHQSSLASWPWAATTVPVMVTTAAGSLNRVVWMVAVSPTAIMPRYTRVPSRRYRLVVLDPDQDAAAETGSPRPVKTPAMIPLIGDIEDGAEVGDLKAPDPQVDDGQLVAEYLVQEAGSARP